MPISGTNLQALRAAISAEIEAITPTYTEHDEVHFWSDLNAQAFKGASPRSFRLIWDMTSSGDGPLFGGGKDDREIDLIIRVGYRGLSIFDAEEMIENDRGDLAETLRNNEGGGITGMIPPETKPRVSIDAWQGGDPDDDDDVPLRVDYRARVRYMVDHE